MKSACVAPARLTGKVAKAAPVAKANKMMVWRPDNNKYLETFSYLPPLTVDQIAKQVDYIVNNNWTPCLEFADAEHAYVSETFVARVSPAEAGYYDNRYWTMWKLPMFGCTDSSQVLKEVEACTKAYPDCYIRMVGFDANRQVQVAGLVVHRPASASDWRKPADRSV